MPSNANPTASSPLSDNHGRTVNYLRLSVTDRCNLRCKYCVSENPTFLEHDHILRYEEMAGLVANIRTLGVEKVRLTGGEPFARKGFTEFVGSLLQADPGLDLRITTNGTLLAPHVPALAEAGVRKINISLDTLDQEDYAAITGRDMLQAVLHSVQACLDAGIRVKLNAVALASLNKKQIPAFLDLIRTRPVDVRFIERMPVGKGSVPEEPVWTAEEVLQEARKYAGLTPASWTSRTAGPARVFDVAGHAGRFGVISGVSQHFCGSCNRLRITSDGRLRTCLFSDKSYRLRPILRHPRLGLKKALEVVRRACVSKPVGHALLERAGQDDAVCSTPMQSIGG